MLPTFLRIARYVDKSGLSKRPRYGSPEYREYIENLGEAIWSSTVEGIQTELLHRGDIEPTSEAHFADDGIDPNIPRGPHHGKPL